MLRKIDQVDAAFKLNIGRKRRWQIMGRSQGVVTAAECIINNR